MVSWIWRQTREGWAGPVGAFPYASRDGVIIGWEVPRVSSYDVFCWAATVPENPPFLIRMLWVAGEVLGQRTKGVCCCCFCVASVVSDSVRPHRLQPTRFLRPWDFPGKNTGVGCHFLLQCMKVKVKSLSRAWLLATPWTAAYRAPPSIGFSRQEYWSGPLVPSPKESRYCQSWVGPFIPSAMLYQPWLFFFT